MDATPDLAPVARATARLLDTAAGLTEEALRAPSLLPGWTRAHVLVHVTRNADGMRNLLLAARTGETAWMYPTAAVRGADIDAAPSRSLEVLLADLRAACDRWRIEADHLPPEAWDREITLGTAEAPGAVVTARRLVGMRLGEVEIHHVDLDHGYGMAAVPDEAADGVVEDLVLRLAVKGAPVRVTSTVDGRSWGDGGPDVRGTPTALLAWLAGRSGGEGCDVPGGSLPVLPPL